MNVRVFFATIVAALLAGLMPAAAQTRADAAGLADRARHCAQPSRRAVANADECRTRPACRNSVADLAGGAGLPVAARRGVDAPDGRLLPSALWRARSHPGRRLPGPWHGGRLDRYRPAHARQRAALLAGMYPRCGNLALRNQANFDVPDPLLHPQPSASCPMDPAATRKAIMARIGGSFASVQRDNAGPLRMMQSVLCPNGTTATAAGGGTCGDATAPTALETGPDGRTRLKGPLGLGSTASKPSSCRPRKACRRTRWPGAGWPAMPRCRNC